MMSLHTHAEMRAFVELCYAARRAFIFVGKHGVGKSEGVVSCAASMGIDVVVFDLSIMEPTDLTGLPRSENQTTVFDAPATLPREGGGLLVLEELNRAPRQMRAPCLQLLTARRLNSYVLPPGWVVCASINDPGDGYDTDELDPALVSRFVQARIEPDVDDWTSWAVGAGVDDVVVDFVRETAGVFSTAAGNPRAWTYASDLVKSWRTKGYDPAPLLPLLAGVLDDAWGSALWSAVTKRDAPLRAVDVVVAYSQHRAKLTRWVRERRLDLVKQSWENLRRHLQPQGTYDALVDGDDDSKLRNIETFIADLAPDVLDEAREWVRDRGFSGIKLPEPSMRRARGRRAS